MTLDAKVNSSSALDALTHGFMFVTMIGIMVLHITNGVIPKEKDMREMGIPENYEFIPYVSHPDHDDWPDLIKRREDLGFAKPWGT
jgi:hypothetical protein